MPLAASRYLFNNAGDITSDSPVLVNPSPAAPSTGNSPAGSSRGNPVRPLTVRVYSTLLKRRSTTRPGSPARANASASRYRRAQPRSNSFSGPVSCGAFFGGISPLSSCSTTLIQALGSRRIDPRESNRSRSNSPFLAFVEWQVTQRRRTSSSTDPEYSRRRTLKSGGAAVIGSAGSQVTAPLARITTTSRGRVFIPRSPRTYGRFGRLWRLAA